MPIELKITIPNLPNMVRAFSKDLTPDISGVIDSTLIPALKAQLKEEAPRVTGLLAESIYSESLGPMAWGFYEGAPYGIFPREGTVPHPIYPLRPAYGLWWEDMRVDHPIAMAPHPGIKDKNQYHLRALDIVRPVFEATLGRIFQRIGEVTRF